MVFLLVGVQILQEGLGFGCRSELGKCSENLATSDGVDINVVSKNGAVGGGDGEGDLGQSRVKRFDPNDSILLVVQAQSAEHTFDLQIGVDWPNTQVISMLVCDARTFGVELDVYAVTISLGREKFASQRDRCGVRILCVVDTLSLGKCASGVFTCAKGIGMSKDEQPKLRRAKHTEIDLFMRMGL